MSIEGKVIQIAIGQVSDDKGYTYPVLYALTSDGRIWTDAISGKEGHYIPRLTYYGNWCSLSATDGEEFIEDERARERADEEYRKTGKI
jgi:hypothetical protein